MDQDIKIDFPQNLDGVDIDRKQKTYYLTINAILNLNNGVGEAIKLQEEILKDINSQSLIGSGIYKYPADTIHFSIINFEGLSSGIDSEELFRQKRQPYIEKIKNILQTFNEREIAQKKIRFAYIYTKKQSSIAIQAFPSKDLCDFFKEMCKKFNEEATLRPVEIKKSEYDGCIRFRVNLVRFFRKLTNEEYDNIAEKVLEINQRSKKGFLFGLELIRISFVSSDNWLSNCNPELSYINLK